MYDHATPSRREIAAFVANYPGCTPYDVHRGLYLKSHTRGETFHIVRCMIKRGSLRAFYGSDSQTYLYID